MTRRMGIHRVRQLGRFAVIPAATCTCLFASVTPDQAQTATYYGKKLGPKPNYKRVPGASRLQFVYNLWPTTGCAQYDQVSFTSFTDGTRTLASLAADGYVVTASYASYCVGAKQNKLSSWDMGLTFTRGDCSTECDVYAASTTKDSSGDYDQVSLFNEVDGQIVSDDESLGRPGKWTVQLP